MKKLITTLLCSIVFSTTSIATEFSEVWKCNDSSRYDYDEDKVIVTAKVNKSLVTGEISVAGVKYTTGYGVKGFNRRWSFGDDWGYSFILRPNGVGHYYEFIDDKVTQPSMSIKCWENK